MKPNNAKQKPSPQGEATIENGPVRSDNAVQVSDQEQERADARERWVAKRRRRQQTLRRDERGQSNLLGLMLSIVIISSVFVMIQTDVGPSVREEYDYRHASTVLEDFQKIQTNLQVSADAGIRQGTVFHTGGRYPNYVVLVHPPGPSGTLQTTEERVVTLSNARATDPEAQEYLSGSEVRFTTTGLEYTPAYAAYKSAPSTMLVNGVLSHDYAHAREVISSPTVVAGRQLSVTTMTGSFSTTQSSPLLLQIEPLSTTTETTSVTDTGQPITLTLQTDLSEDVWREILVAEIDPETSRVSPSTDDDDRYIAAIRLTEGPDLNTLEIYLETGVTYDLQMSRVGVRTGEQVPFAESEAPPTAYMTAVTDRTPILVEQTSTDLVVEVRDSYSNSQPRVKVSATVLNGGGSLDRIEALTTGQGRVTFEYTAPEITASTSDVNEQTAQVRVRIADTAGGQYEVVFEVQIQNTHN